MKKSYRQLHRENKRLREEFRPVVQAFRNSAEQVLGEAAEDMTHALLGQEILISVVKQVAYKEITASEAKLWIEQKWDKRHEFEGTEEEKIDWLGVPGIHERFKEINDFVQKSIGDRALKLFMLEREALLENDGERNENN